MILIKFFDYSAFLDLCMNEQLKIDKNSKNLGRRVNVFYWMLFLWIKIYFFNFKVSKFYIS